MATTGAVAAATLLLGAGAVAVAQIPGTALDDRRRAADVRALVQHLSSGLDPAAIGSYYRRWCRVGVRV